MKLNIKQFTALYAQMDIYALFILDGFSRLASCFLSHMFGLWNSYSEEFFWWLYFL